MLHIRSVVSTKIGSKHTGEPIGGDGGRESYNGAALVHDLVPKVS